MLWVIAFLLLVLSVPAVLISQHNRDKLLDAVAMHERLQRTAPDNPLAQLGPTEFQRAYEIAMKSRGRAVLLWTSLGLLVGLIPGLPLAVAIAWLMDAPDAIVGAFALVLFGCLFGGMWIGFARRKNVYDIMRAKLQYD